MRKTWHLVVAIGCLLFGGASYNVNKQTGIMGIALGIIIGIFYFFPKIGQKDPAEKKPGQQDELPVQEEEEEITEDDGDDTPEE